MTILKRYIDTEVTGGSQNGLDWDNAYPSLASWEVAERRDLVATSDIMEAYCRGKTDDSGLSLASANWNASVDHYIHLIVAQEDRHLGVWDDDKYNLTHTVNGEHAIYNETPGLWISGLQIETSHGGGVSYLLRSNDNRILGVKVNNCIGRGYSGSYPYGGSGGFLYVSDAWNNIVYRTVYSLITGRVGSNYEHHIYNNTIRRWWIGYGITVNSSEARVKNNIAVYSDNRVAFRNSYGWHADCDYNISWDDTAPGAHSIHNATGANAPAFISTTSGSYDLHLTEDDTIAKNKGIDLSGDPGLAFDTDIDGDLRRANWCIGADDFDEGPPPVPPTLDKTFLFEPNWEKPVTVSFSWKTAIQKAISGNEKRSGIYTFPHKNIKYKTSGMDAAEFNFIKRQFFIKIPDVWDIPHWPDRVTLTAEAVSGTTILTVTSTANMLFSLFGRCIIIGENSHGYYGVDNVTTLAITLSEPLTETWPIGTSVYPGFSGRVKTSQDIEVITPGLGDTIIDITETVE